MPEIDRDFVVFAKRLMRHKKSIEQKTDQLVKDTFLTIARSVTMHNPVASGQSVLNWTAAISTKKPKARFVNVDRTNTRIAKRTTHKKLADGVTRRRKLRRVSGGKQGAIGSIQFDRRIATTSRVVAFAAIKDVVSTFSNPSKPSSALPRPTDVIRRTSAMSPPALFLSNHIKYSGKLWSGSWKSNPRTLASEVNAAKVVVNRAKILGR